MIEQLHRGGEGYPTRLVAVEGGPEDLWVSTEGQRVRPWDERPFIAVVGARRARSEHCEVAREMARGLVERGFGVVSGGAVGIDGAAHEGAVAAGGCTVVVLGSGIDAPYPEQNVALFERVVRQGGALISQFPRDFAPTRWSFPRRNRVIAALAQAVVVVEAELGSGALITAAAAKEYGRPVLAVLGSAGCASLVIDGDAQAVRSAADVWARVEGRAASPPAPPSDPRAAKLLDALDATPRDLGELASRAGLPTDEAMALAIDLELEGLVARAAGGRYLRLNW